MNKIIIFFLLYTFQFDNVDNSSIMSECYSYHTLHFYEVSTQNEHVIFQHTVKDPNGVSYVSRDKIVLDSINSKGFKIHGEDAEKFLFSTIDGYFYSMKKVYDIKNYRVFKIPQSNYITETIGTNFIRKKGLWYHTSPKNSSKEVIEKELKEMPIDLEVFETGFLKEGTLFKNKNAVYIFDKEKVTFKKVPNLTGRNTNYVKIGEITSEGFIYDDDTFYLVKHNKFKNYTKQFTTHQDFINFKNVEIIQHEYDVSINTNDGMIWLYLKYAIENEKGEKIKIVPVKASYFGKKKELINYNNLVYHKFNNLLNNQKPIDITAIKDPFNLVKDYFFYNDGKMRYIIDYKKHAFKPIEWLPSEAVFYPSNETYGYLNTNSFFADNDYIYFIKTLEKKSKTLKHTSVIKDLKLAYAYDDKLLIENKEIINISDRLSIEFIGSTVNVISPCDNGYGTYPVKIDIYYFFKDKNGVYVYNSSNSKMRKIENQKTSKVKIDAYDYLMQLMKMI